MPATAYPQPADVVRFYRQAIERVAQIPGVRAAGAVRVLPLARTIGDWSIKIEGRPYVPEENPNGDFQAVTPGYFQAMGLKLVRGRFLTDADREDTMPAAVINDTMAARYWPNEDADRPAVHDGHRRQTLAHHRRHRRHGPPQRRRRRAAQRDVRRARAAARRTFGSAPRGMTLVVKTDTNPLALAGQVRDAIRAIDRNLPVSDIRTMEQVAATALSQPRFVTFLLALFAGTALTLAAIGIYGTISLLVAERTQEMGIRLALGANRPAILRLVLGQGMMLTAIGLAIGVAGATVLTRTLSGLIYGVGTLELRCTDISRPTASINCLKPPTCSSAPPMTKVWGCLCWRPSTAAFRSSRPMPPFFARYSAKSGIYINPADPASAAERIAAVLSMQDWRARFVALAEQNLARWNDLARGDRETVVSLIAGLAA